MPANTRSKSADLAAANALLAMKASRWAESEFTVYQTLFSEEPRSTFRLRPFKTQGTAARPKRACATYTPGMYTEDE
jgi:hypothetical protein